MRKFATQYDARERVKENIGSPVKQLYNPIFDDRGIMHLKESGKHDLYMEIQSHRDSVDIHVLLARYRCGDTEALNRVQGAYGDFTQMPTTFAEALNTMIAAEQYFQALPVDVRARFGHNFNAFIASMDSPTWAADAGITPPVPVADTVTSSSTTQTAQSEIFASSPPSGVAVNAAPAASAATVESQILGGKT